MKKVACFFLSGLMGFILTSCIVKPGPGYTPPLLYTSAKSCLIVRHSFYYEKGKGCTTVYTFPAGVYCPVFRDKFGTYYDSPNFVYLHNYGFRHDLRGGIYISKKNVLYSYTYPTEQPFRYILIQGSPCTTIPPIINSQIPIQDKRFIELLPSRFYPHLCHVKPPYM